MPFSQLKTFFFFVFCIRLLLFGNPIKAQDNNADRQALLAIKAKADTSIKKFSAEKVHLQLDRPYYSIGDTIWFKGWVVDAAYTQLSVKSGLLHIDIATDSNVVVQNFLLPVENGVTWGNIALNEKLYKPGNYTIRAYTNWMRNFGDETFFDNRFNVTGTYEDNWTVKVNTDTTHINGQPNVKAKLQFSYVDKSPVIGKPIAMQVISGRKAITKYTLDTELTGTVDVNFSPPKKGKDLFISARVDNKGNTVNIPIDLKRVEDIDVQFMPEGGNMISDLATKIGFKAIDSRGKGIKVTGVVTDSKGNSIIGITSTNFGMGSFIFNPGVNEKYFAKIEYGGSNRLFALPKVLDTGLGMFVLNRLGADSLRVTLSATPDVIKQNGRYFLMAKSNGIICYAAIIGFKDIASVTYYLKKNLFPTGIVHIILADNKGRTINERLAFVNHNDNLIVHTSFPHQIPLQDSINLNFSVTDRKGKPMQGNFSVAVTNNARVKLDSINDVNIINSLLLTSQLKGYVESPGYYFTQSAEAWQALDDLLLTQGWVSYDAPSKGITFRAEEDYSVNGRLKNLFGKPAAGLGISMVSLRPLYTKDTVTSKDGRFKIPLPLVDTPAFILKAIKKNGKPSGIPITVNEFEAPTFTTPELPAALPWNLNTSDTILSDINYKIKERKAVEKLPEGTRLLQGVTITGKKSIKNSKNLNGAGNADLVLDEKDMEAAGKKTLLDIIEERVKGFITRYPRRSEVAWYYVKDKFAIFIVDGFELNKLLEPKSYIDIRDYLKTYTAESVKGIELIYSSKYNFSYLSKFFPMANIVLQDFAFIEITTRSGQGPIMADARGIYLYKPLPLSIPSKFYQPKYTANLNNSTLANRPTIAWEPDVVTNTDGKASVSFNTGNTPGNYTVVIQGIGADGGLGVKYIPLKIQTANP